MAMKNPLQATNFADVVVAGFWAIAVVASIEIICETLKVILQ